MNTNNLWSKSTELLFFNQYLKQKQTEQIFYTINNNRHMAYYPKNYHGKKTTIQSRNTLIGQYAEKWTQKLLENIIKEDNLHIISHAQCNQIGLNKRSPADLVISTKNKTKLQPNDIKIIFEVKMSLVWNWEINIKNNQIKEVGDYKTHQGKPGLLRSDSMLKAIGKCINIRVSDYTSANIPLIVMGNTPITKTYYTKVDHLKKSGIIQGFWSINPKPLNNEDTIKTTTQKGFIRYDNTKELHDSINKLLTTDLNFFSSMKSTKKLGQIIEKANMEKNYENKGLQLLRLLRGT